MVRRPGLFIASMVAALTGVLLGGPGGLPTAQAESTVTVLVQTGPGALGSVEQAVARLDGHVGGELPIIDGVAAPRPEAGVAALGATPGVVAVTPNRPVTFTGQYGEGSGVASA